MAKKKATTKQQKQHNKKPQILSIKPHPLGGCNTQWVLHEKQTYSQTVWPSYWPSLQTMLWSKGSVCILLLDKLLSTAAQDKKWPVTRTSHSTARQEVNKTMLLSSDKHKRLMAQKFKTNSKSIIASFSGEKRQVHKSKPTTNISDCLPSIWRV